MAIDPASWADLDRAEIVRQIQDSARQLYALKEAELPVRIALTRFLAERSQHSRPATTAKAWPPGRRNGSTPSSTPTSSGRCFGPRSRRSCSSWRTSDYQGAELADELERKLDAAYPPCSWSGEAHRDWRRRGPGRPGRLGP